MDKPLKFYNMPLIENIEELLLYVEVDRDMNFDKLKKFINQAERELVVLLGPSLFNFLHESNQQIKGSFMDYTANKAVLLSLNSLKTKVGNTGVKATTPSKTEEAKWYELKDLARDLNKAASSALDFGLQLLANEQSSAWKDSPIYKNTEGLYIKTLQEFEIYFSLNNSYTTFNALVPFMREIQDQMIDSMLRECTEGNLTEQMINRIKAIIANMTIARVCETGIFTLEATGALVKIEVLPWEQLKSISDQRLMKLAKQRLNIAEGYISMLSKLLVDLPCYDVKTSGHEIQKLNSGLYF